MTIYTEMKEKIFNESLKISKVMIWKIVTRLVKISMRLETQIVTKLVTIFKYRLNNLP